MFGRFVLAMITALALALGPAVMPGEAAMAAAPASHHGAMAPAGHCDEQPLPDRQDHGGKADKGCCVAGCTAVAALPSPVMAPSLPARSIEQPAPDRFRTGYLGEIATPPPRPA